MNTATMQRLFAVTFYHFVCAANYVVLNVVIAVAAAVVDVNKAIFIFCQDSDCIAIVVARIRSHV